MIGDNELSFWGPYMTDLSFNWGFHEFRDGPTLTSKLYEHEMTCLGKKDELQEKTDLISRFSARDAVVDVFWWYRGTKAKPDTHIEGISYTESKDFWIATSPYIHDCRNAEPHILIWWRKSRLLYPGHVPTMNHTELEIEMMRCSVKCTVDMANHLSGKAEVKEPQNNHEVPADPPIANADKHVAHTERSQKPAEQHDESSVQQHPIAEKTQPSTAARSPPCERPPRSQASEASERSREIEQKRDAKTEAIKLKQEQLGMVMQELDQLRKGQNNDLKGRNKDPELRPTGLEQDRAAKYTIPQKSNADIQKRLGALEILEKNRLGKEEAREQRINDLETKLKASEKERIDKERDLEQTNAALEMRLRALEDKHRDLWRQHSLLSTRVTDQGNTIANMEEMIDDLLASDSEDSDDEEDFDDDTSDAASDGEDFGPNTGYTQIRTSRGFSAPDLRYSTVL